MIGHLARAVHELRARRCPYCGSRNTTHIIYGMYLPPNGVVPDGIVLGGCVILDGQPLRHCHACGRGFDFRDLGRNPR
jgi:hypothetical protein